MDMTLSFVKGKGYLNHNERKFYRSNVDENRVKDNIYFKQESVKEAYEKLFGEFIEKYNDKQKRADRKKTVEGYLQSIQDGQDKKNGEKVFYETIVMLGDKFTAGILNNPEQSEQAKKVLIEYAKTFQERNPNLYLFNASLHMDEETPHLHLDYIPVATGYKKGLERRNSLSKALEQQGMKSSKGQFDNATIEWQKRERAFLSDLAKKQEINIVELGEKREDLSLFQYKKLTEEAKKEAKKAATVSDFKTVSVLGVSFSKSSSIEALKVREKAIKEQEHMLSMTIEKSAEQERIVRETLRKAEEAEKEAEQLKAKAEAEEKKALEARNEYERLYLEQKTLNIVYARLEKLYKAEKERSKEREKESYDQGDLNGIYSVLANLNRRVYIVDDEKSEQYLLGYYLDSNNKEVYFVKYANLDSAKSSLEQRNIHNYQMHTDRQTEHEQNKPKIRFHRGGSGRDRGGMER